MLAQESETRKRERKYIVVTNTNEIGAASIEKDEEDG